MAGLPCNARGYAQRNRGDGALPTDAATSSESLSYLDGNAGYGLQLRHRSAHESSAHFFPERLADEHLYARSEWAGFAVRLDLRRRSSNLSAEGSNGRPCGVFVASTKRHFRRGGRQSGRQLRLGAI